MLENLYKSIIAKMLRSTTEFQMGRLTDVLRDINTLLGRGFDDFETHITDRALQFATAEMTFTGKALQAGTNVFLSTPALHQLEQAVLLKGMDTPIGTGRLTLGEALKAFISKKKLTVNQIINDGILLGETTQQITSSIMSQFKRVQRDQVKTLVRTATNHAAAQARKTLFSQNSEILDGEEWVATLDSRTTLICAGRDGRVYPVGRGPYPPAHWNCRSVRVAVIKDEFASISQTARRPEVAAKGRGTTSSQTKFDGWLRRQPADFQDEYFSQFPNGLKKAKLFRKGVPIDRFRDESGRDFTLEQLEALNPIATGEGIPR
ncbi:MAG: phage head morphogenesis protein [Gammaproteobacteria bacterium]|nr:phage head morphogenesis protein [Gammaproteobacteria bacterium]